VKIDEACPVCWSMTCTCTPVPGDPSEASEASDPSDTAPACDLAAALDSTRAFLRRFVVLPSDAALTAVTLWAAHTHAVDAFDSTPRVAFLSPEPASGKSRALEVLATLVPHAMHAVNASPAALFRSVSDLEERPTILFDEIDTVFGPKAKDNEEVRGFLNAGHRRGAVAYRCVGLGTQQTVTPFPAFCAVAVAGLNDIPDTIATRSVIVRMRKRARNEPVEPWRARKREPEGHDLRDRLAYDVHAILDDLATAEPSMPPGVEDRAADVWEPLLAIADAAGGQWPTLARTAAAELIEGGSNEPSLGVLLLEHLAAVWADQGNPPAIGTASILDALVLMDEAPWQSIKGAPIDARRLAHLLKQYEVTSKKVRVGDVTVNGYRREDLWDAWTRYVPDALPPSPEVQNMQNTRNTTGDPAPTEPPLVTDVPDVPDFGEGPYGADH